MLNSQCAHISRIDLPVWEYPNGQQLTLPIFRIKGNGSGRSAYIQANIHGAEVQGNAVIYHLLNYFAQNPPSGDITLVPFANPFANTQKGGEHTLGRHDPTTGQNWNRHYIDLVCKNKQDRKFAEQIDLELFAKNHINLPWEEIQDLFRQTLRKALQSYRIRKSNEGLNPAEQVLLPLQELALEADSVLDLHTSPVGTHYAYAPEYAAASACHLQVPYLLLIPNQFNGALDEGAFSPWWRLHEELIIRGYANIPIDFESFTLEYGNQGELDLESAQKEAHGILSYLTHRGTVTSFEALPPVDCIACLLENYLTVYSKGGGLVDYHATPGQQVKKEERIATILNLHPIRDGEEIQNALHVVSAPEAGIILLRYPTASIHSGTELFKLMTKVQNLK